jgi:hypothetical protein
MKLALRIITAIFIFTVVPLVNAFGQAAPRPISGESDRHRTESERDLEIRIWNLRSLSEQPHPTTKEQPTIQQALAEMQKDFTKLQVANKNLLRVALGNGTLDPKFVLKSVTEIKACADRLSKNLALPEIDKTQSTNAPATPTTIADPQHLKRSVLRLGTLIFSFIDNPFFKEISVIDAQLTVKARRDLDDIIELSALIKKSEEK